MPGEPGPRGSVTHNLGTGNISQETGPSGVVARVVLPGLTADTGNLIVGGRSCPRVAPYPALSVNPGLVCLGIPGPL